MNERKRAKRIRRLEDRIADTRATMRFFWLPSKLRQMQEDIDKWEAELTLLNDADGPH